MVAATLIREARLRAGLTQAELAERADTAPSAIGRWERGEVRPSLETVKGLCRAAGYDLTLGLTPTDSHDRTLIRACLERTPAQRLSDMLTAVRALERMASAAERYGRV
jgi:transcriptional regulator with XRE-family HTH domain